MNGEKLGMETEKNEITVPSLVEGLEHLVFSIREQPEEAVRVLSRRHFEMPPDFFANTERLNDDPIMAASLVRATSEDYEINPNPESLENIVINAALAAAKIETAEESLNPTKEQRGLFDGLKENLIGLAAFVSNSKRLRYASIASLLVASMAAGCKSVDTVATQEISKETTIATQKIESTKEGTDGSTPDGSGTETALEETKITVETDSSNPETFPTVTLDDIESGEILAAEREYLETHNPFTGNETWPEEFKIFYGYDKAYQFIDFNLNNVPAMEGYRDNPETIPARTMFYYKLDLPDGYFPVPEDIRKAPDYNLFDYFLVGQVWLNPDWSEGDPVSDRYRILHYLLQDARPYELIPSDLPATYIPMPVHSLGKLFDDDNYVTGIIEYVWKYVYANQYGEEFPQKYIEEWAETGRIPAELEGYVLACQPERFN